ncbi:MAG: hypothetical protein H3C38_14685 [Rhodospirillales bacterium]|nr:hypothetical protein [Rhodospirillales bacterium]
MTDPQTPIRTSLQGRIPPALTPEQVRERARREAVRAWNSEARILIVAVDDARLTWPERELVRQLGDKLAGQGRGR